MFNFEFKMSINYISFIPYNVDRRNSLGIEAYSGDSCGGVLYHGAAVGCSSLDLYNTRGHNKKNTEDHKPVLRST